MTLSPAEWKRFYEAERARLGEPALDAMLEQAAPMRVGAKHAAIFPHTRLEVTGAMVASVARGVAESGADEVLAIGVLHGSPSPERRVHLPGEDSTRDEFSLDAFAVLLARTDRAVRVHARYPLRVGDNPATVPGIDELARLAERMPVVATTDPVHHGVGYGDDARLTRDARALIDEQLGALERHDYAGFQQACVRARSDFRDVGPTLAHVLGAPRFEVRELLLVDYSEALVAERPTWVAGALIEGRT